MYIVSFLPSATKDILQIEESLSFQSYQAEEKFTNNIEKIEKLLTMYPFMYPIYEDDVYFRQAVLVYQYCLFYHVDEKNKNIFIHRILHSMRDISELI